MTISRKEFILLFRSPLFIFVTSSLPILIGLWYVFVLNSLELKLVNYTQLYSILPTFISLTIPLFTQGIWQNDRNSSLIGDYLISSIGLVKIILSKTMVIAFYYIVLIILLVPITFSISKLGFVDIGEVLGLHIALILYLLFSISIGLFFSAVLKGRIFTYIVTLTSLLFFTSGKIFTTGFVNNILGYILLTPRLGRFYSGFIKLTDVLYIIFLSLLFFYISILIIKKQVNIKVLILLSIIFLLSFLKIDLDLTKRGSYSINNVTKELVNNAKIPINLTYYYSSNIEDISEYLEQFDKLDNINYREVSKDNKLFSKAVKSFKPIEIEDSGLYSFIVIEYLTKYRVLPIVSVIESLEFDLLKEFLFLITGELDNIGIVIGDNEYIQDDFSILLEVLEKDFNVEFLNRENSIPKYIDSIIVIGHKNIDYDYISKIGDYLSNGGSILIAANGVDISNNLAQINTPLLDSLAYSGIFIDPFLIGDNNNVGILDDDGRLTPYPLNVITRPNPVLKDIPLLNPFPSFNAIYLSPVRSVIPESKELLVTSKDSWVVNSQSGLDGIPIGSQSGAIYLETDLWKHFSGKESTVSNRVLILGNTRSLTNLSYNLGISNGYDFILRSLYSLLGKEDHLTVKYKFNFDNKYNYKDLNTNLFKLFYVFIYPLIILIASLLLAKRFK